MNWARPAFLKRIDCKRITPEQRTQLEPFLTIPEVQAQILAVLWGVAGKIDIMSRRVRSCLTEDWIQVFDIIAAEREQKRLLVEKLRHRQWKSGNWNKMTRR